MKYAVSGCDRVGFVRAKSFYDRQKVRLGDLRQIRAEMCIAYRACVRRELAWEDFRAATLGLSRIASIDQGGLIDQRIADLEQKLAAILPKANGHDTTEARL